MISKHIAIGMLCTVLLAIAGCGDSGGDSGGGSGGTSGGDSASLSADQQSALTQVQDNFNKLKADAEKVIEELKSKAESPEADQAVAALQTALGDTQEVVTALQSTAGADFDTKQAAVQDALKELAAKYSDALAKSKLGGIKVPGL